MRHPAVLFWCHAGFRHVLRKRVSLTGPWPTQLLTIFSITFFTNLIYTTIRYTVANGDVSPFVGHNAILRWSAVQEVAYNAEDGYENLWSEPSESHVSEDFDMSLRLQCTGHRTLWQFIRCVRLLLAISFYPLR